MSRGQLGVSTSVSISGPMVRILAFHRDATARGRGSIHRRCLVLNADSRDEGRVTDQGLRFSAPGSQATFSHAVRRDDGTG